MSRTQVTPAPHIVAAWTVMAVFPLAATYAIAEDINKSSDAQGRTAQFRSAAV